ncbi:hypothetical protein TYRP_016246 [Tyrophagus putrescentiae]|nr:hypothetical protein TYRP_016246 [Tyrophagus putrescentiae]
MRRLGLPLSFCSRKNRRAKRKKKDEKNAAAATYRKVEQQTAVRKDAVAAGAFRNLPPPSAFASTAHRSPPPDGFELIDFDDHEEKETADAAELTAGVEEADVTSLGSRGGGSGSDEVATLELADDSYDFIELDKLRISVSADDKDCPDQQQQLKRKVFTCQIDWDDLMGALIDESPAQSSSSLFVTRKTGEGDEEEEGSKEVSQCGQIGNGRVVRVNAP